VTGRHTSRMSIGRLFAAGLVYAQAFYWLVMGAFLLLDWATYGRVPFADAGQAVVLVVGSASVAVLIAPAFLLMVWLMPVRVTADTLTSTNAIGFPLTVPWDAVSAVRLFHMPGLPYLIVTAGRKRVWLPLFVDGLPELAERVRESAGEDHPLTAALAARVTRQ
jgi:hypothetical protein